ncbi:hypothetical protein [Arthrobacter alpinus]|nr:hypothetical protein [Arthrobacter alpinus]
MVVTAWPTCTKVSPTMPAVPTTLGRFLGVRQEHGSHRPLGTQ